jgi:hypothetical protein
MQIHNGVYERVAADQTTCSQLSMSRAWPRNDPKKKNNQKLESDLRKQQKALCSSVDGD